MVSKRQKLARKRFKEANPHLFPKTQQPTPPASEEDPNSKRKKKKKRNNKLFKKKHQNMTEEVEIKLAAAAQTKKKILRKHPLRLPGMRPGESCFICKASDHIAKLCPQKSKSLWEKNKICLHCRRRGHSLRNCPDKSDDNGKKYCYNCGEVGHSLFNCSRPLQDGGTKFATCFICNACGHLSKNCPKNTHGIYPKGGSCKICGGVTHLAKHCPNKGSKSNTSDSGLEDTLTLSECGEIRRGKVTIFQSGDDLEDDFMVVGNATDGKKGLEFEVEKDIDVKPKNNHAPKVVNFLR